MKCTHFIFICHILLLIIYWCWLFFHVQIVLIILNWCLCDFLVLKHINEVDALHLHLSFTDVDMFQYCFWLFTDVDYCLCAKCSYHSQLMFMWFSCTETYRWSGCTSSSFVIDIFFVWKIFYNFNTAFDNLLMLTIFYVQNVLIILNWCLCDFLVLKHIDEVHALHLHLSLTYFLCGKYSTISILLLIIYWCWLFFHVQNVLIILNWCLCDFLLLKHIDEVHAFHLHLSFTDVDIFLCQKCSRISILLLVIYWCWLFFMWKCSYHSRLMFVWFSCTETYWWSGHTSFSYVIDIFFVWKIFYNFNIAFDYLLMLTIFHVKMFLSFSTDVYVIFLYWNILMKCTHFIFICHILLLIIYWCWLFFHVQIVLIILNWCLCDFLVLKHINEVDALHLHLSFTDVDMFQYCFWLFTDVDYFFMCKMFLSFSTDVYVIFLYWNILMKCTHFIFICHWHIFCVENILQFQYCFWLFTDIDYFLCAKCTYHSRLMFMWFSVTETY